MSEQRNWTKQDLMNLGLYTRGPSDLELRGAIELLHRAHWYVPYDNDAAEILITAWIEVEKERRESIRSSFLP